MRWSRSFLRHQIGRRGAALLFFAILDVTYAFGLLFPPKTASEFYVFLASIMPLWAWAAVWAGTGLCLFINAFKVKDRVGFAAAMFLKVLWGAVALLGWIAGHADRGYISAAIWLAAAGWIGVIASWPEPSDYDLRKVD